MKQPFLIPGFELIEKIGQGGMAVVWKARQVSLDRVVAIKLLNSVAACRPEEQQRLMAEAHAAAHLKHPGMVQVYDAGIVDGISYFVMEYVAGYSVGQWLRRKKVLPAEDALVVAECVAQALHYAWSTASIIHCDVKPDNVMVDLDGTIKIADLGLARTIDSVQADADRKIEVMGTPGYISPEQSGGMADLDCRADIYSLGATLYNLVTGQRLFERHGETEVMDLQVTGHEKDPLLVRPELPLEICWLIEKMLVKDRNYRYPDWDAVLADIDRVKQGRLPMRPYPPTGTSTITRCDARIRRTREREQALMLEQKRRDFMRRLPMVAGVSLLAVVTLVIWMDARRKSRRPEPETHPAPTAIMPGLTNQVVAGEPSESVPDTPDAARELYDFVMRWINENPGNYDEAIRRLAHVADSARGTKYALMAEDRIASLRDERDAAVEAAWDSLAAAVADLAADERCREAADTVAAYDGRWRDALAPRLEALEAEMSKHAETHANAQNQIMRQADRRLSRLMDETVTRLLEGTPVDALQQAHAGMQDPQLVVRQAELAAVSEVLRAATDLDREVLDSFLPQRGEELAIAFEQGTRTFVVRGVRDGRLRLEQRLDGGARVEFEFGVADLAPREYLARLDRPDRPEVALVAGWHRYRDGDYAAALERFAMTHPLLANRLVDRVRQARQVQLETSARDDFLRLLEVFNLPSQPFDIDAVRRAIQAVSALPVAATGLQGQIEQYREAHHETEFWKQVEPLVEELLAQLKRLEDRVDEAEPPATGGDIDQRDLNAVVEMLLNRNPDLRSHEIRVLRDDHNRAIGLEIRSRALRDIGALAPLRAISVLRCHGGEIADLSVLANLTRLTELSIEGCVARDFQAIRDLPLQRLSLPHSGFSDVALLRRMPLRDLNLAGTSVRDISGLRELSLRSLDLENTRVFALHGISGMPLERLNLAGTQVRDIALLRGMPLQELNLARTSVFDFSVLRGMPLRSLDLADTQFRDLTLLDGMPLQSLDISDTRISDVALLRDLPLRHLALRNTPVRDLSVLRGAILQSLSVQRCGNLRTLDFVEGMPLRELRICGSGINSLSGLKTPELQTLLMENTSLTDISPLQELPIRRLYMRGSPVRDFSPLLRMPVQELTLDTRSQSARDILWRIRTLRRVNHRRWPPDER